MSTFVNQKAMLKSFNQFRVVITTPDATTSATTFCGVVCLFVSFDAEKLIWWQMAHGASTTGGFEGFVHRSIVESELCQIMLCCDDEIVDYLSNAKELDVEEDQVRSDL